MGSCPEYGRNACKRRAGSGAHRSPKRRYGCAIRQTSTAGRLTGSTGIRGLGPCNSAGTVGLFWSVEGPYMCRRVRNCQGSRTAMSTANRNVPGFRRIEMSSLGMVMGCGRTGPLLCGCSPRRSRTSGLFAKGGPPLALGAVSAVLPPLERPAVSGWTGSSVRRTSTRIRVLVHRGGGGSRGAGHPRSGAPGRGFRPLRDPGPCGPAEDPVRRTAPRNHWPPTVGTRGRRYRPG